MFLSLISGFLWPQQNIIWIKWIHKPLIRNNFDYHYLMDFDRGIILSER